MASTIDNRGHAAVAGSIDVHRDLAGEVLGVTHQHRGAARRGDLDALGAVGDNLSSVTPKTKHCSSSIWSGVFKQLACALLCGAPDRT